MAAGLALSNGPRFNSECVHRKQIIKTKDCCFGLSLKTE